MWKKRALLGTKLTVSLGLGAWLIRDIVARDGVEALLGSELALDARWIAVAIALHFAAVFFGVLRWRLLLGARGVELPLSRLARSFLEGRFIGAFTPSTTGLDGYRAVDVARRTGRPGPAAAVIVIEKLVGLVGMAIVCALLAPFGALDRLGPAAIGCAIAMASVAALGLGVLASPERARAIAAWTPARLQRLAERVADAASGGLSRPLLVRAVILGIASHLAISAVFAATAASLGVGAPLGELLGVGNAITIAVLLPLSIGGVGVREGVAVALLAGAGIATRDAMLVALLGWLTGQAPALLGGLSMIAPEHGAPIPLREPTTAS